LTATIIGQPDVRHAAAAQTPNEHISARQHYAFIQFAHWFS
jgi:hypothetical protein